MSFNNIDAGPIGRRNIELYFANIVNFKFVYHVELNIFPFRCHNEYEIHFWNGPFETFVANPISHPATITTTTLTTQQQQKCKRPYNYMLFYILLMIEKLQRIPNELSFDVLTSNVILSRNITKYSKKGNKYFKKMNSHFQKMLRNHCRR